MTLINRRHNHILHEIVNENFKTILEYSKIYGVSERTIRNDIKEINMTLELKQQPLIQVNEDGKIYIDRYLKIDQSVISSLAQESNFYTYKLSSDERKTILAMALFNTDNYITIARLSELVFMSRNTLLNDLDELKVWFAENDMQLISQTRKGFTVLGSEKEIRDGILKLLLLNGEIFGHRDSGDNGENDIFQTLLLQELDKNEIFDKIRKLIRNSEEKNDVHLTDFSYRELSYYLLIAVNRLIKNKPLPEEKGLDWSVLGKSSKYEMAASIMESLKNKFVFTVYPQETASLIEVLKTKSYIKNNGRSIDMIDVQILINEFIYKISESLQINYYLDFYLYDLLIDHLRSAVHRLKQNHSLINPFLPQLEEMYTDVFESVKEHIKSLEEHIKHEFTNDEISFIVMYIVAVMEKNKARDVSVNTIIVCNTGRGTAQLISAKLQSLSNQIKVIDIISCHSMMERDNDNIDMVVSTVPLNEINIPYLQINPILKEDDLYKIQRLAANIQEEKQKKLKITSKIQKSSTTVLGQEDLYEGEKTFGDILSEDRIMIDVDAESWQESVQIAGDILYHKNKVNKNYTEAMIRNINENGPYVVIYPGIAIPHGAMSDGAIDTSASLIRLNKPVHFHHEENDPVKYVIALSVIDSDSLGKPLYTLTKMLGTGTFVDEINKAKSGKAILEIIREYEKAIRKEIFDNNEQQK